MNSDLRILIALQDIDQKITSLKKQIVVVPTKTHTFQQELQRLRQSHEERAAHNQDLAKRRRAYEGEVDMMRAKLSKLKDQLMSVKTNKEYTAMLHEIQLAEGQIRIEEDKILEIMEAMEQLERELKVSENDLKSQAIVLQENIRQLEKSVPELEAEMARLESEKSLMEERVEAELLLRYRLIAEHRKGIALAEAKDELCSACHVRIRPQVYAELRRAEAIYSCDSCDRILYLREAI